MTAVFVGWLRKTRWSAAPGLMANDALATACSVSDDATSRYPVPANVMRKSANVAAPATAFTLVVPASAAPPGFETGAMPRVHRARERREGMPLAVHQVDFDR